MTAREDREPSIYEQQGLTTSGPSKRGRPPVVGGPEGSTQLSIRVSKHLFDSLQSEASQRHMEFADYIRQVLSRR